MIVPAAMAADMFVPIVHMARRPACNAFLDGKHIHRPATTAGTVAIRDRRIPSYTDSTIVDNVSFYISFADLARLVEQAGGRRVDAFPHLLDRAQDDPILYMLARTSEAAMDYPSEVSSLFLDQLYNTVCAHVAATYGGVDLPAHPSRGGLPARQEARVRDLLLTNLRGDVSLARLAALCDLSERHFSRAFKQSVGASPHRWLLLKRIEHAQALLKGSNMAISQIALDCGFAGQSHLGRVFTKVIGISPGAWRRAQKN
ncbi:helix-turn-helix domain-containing protein [Acidisphaera sp. L21]|uniref:helix-turn-helix domain-containing protein n=1 Tax=Acidisphaera sp. L21 TaxID=1641851 RepID=UPI00131DE1E4|nr:AraC family transcriptional regulator [Acidisphaera sp. L21]